MSDNKDKIVTRWTVQPLRELEADVPVPIRVEAVTDAQVAVQLNVGEVYLIDAEGTIYNEHGTAVCRLAAVRENDND